jgi:hypothetical protein
MNRLKSLGIAVGIAALAACGGDADDMNAVNADLNATDNMMLPPEDNLAANVDMNVDLNNTADTNAVDNSANNSVNAY